MTDNQSPIPAPKGEESFADLLKASFRPVAHVKVGEVATGKVISIGPLAQYVLDHRIPIEVCLSSNVHTGATPSLADHPFPHYLSKGYRVTLNTDNRLMSRTSMTDEYLLAHDQFGLTLDQLEKIAINGMKSAFSHYDERIQVIFERIKPGYADLRASLTK